MGFQNLTPAAPCRKHRVGPHLPPARAGPKVHAMRRPVVFIAALVLAREAGAQRVPGRDLLDFPLGALAEPPVIASSDVALWNPANIIPAAGNRGRVGFAALQTP